MALEVETRDSSALTDADLDEMASMGGNFDIGLLSKAKEDWVLNTTARVDGKLQGFSFSTLERIGGTPCVLLGLMSVKRTTKRDTVLKGLMTEAYHRALMAFPDEDVVVGSRFASADGLEAFKSLTEMIPRPGHRAVGEERACQLRRAVLHREGRRPVRLSRPRVVQARQDERGNCRDVLEGSRRQGWRAHRPRLDDDRKPRQARQARLVGAQRTAWNCVAPSRRGV